MITMDTLRPDLTPYGACPTAESIDWPVTEPPAADAGPSAAPAIGNRGRFSGGLYRQRTEANGGWPRIGRRSPDRRGGIDWDLLLPLAARSQHGGIDWDRLLDLAPDRPFAEIGGDLARDREGSAP
jgi:hypothetical protein